MNAYVAEFFGTLLLILLGDGVVAAVMLKKSKAENAGFLTVVIAWGLAVTFAIYAVGNISGAHLNPAVTIAFAINGSFPTNQIFGYILAQFAGAIVGHFSMASLLTTLERNTDPATKLGVFCNSPAIKNTFSNLVSEIIATAVFVMGLLFLGTNEFTQGFKPVVVGLLIISIGLSLGGTTGFAINPARDLGPRIVHFILPIHGKGKSDWEYAWIPVVGPMVGGSLGAFIYKAIF